MSLKTIGEIAVWMVAAAAIGALIGFVLGVISKAATSMWNRSHKHAAERAQLLDSHSHEVKRLEAKNDDLNALLGEERKQSILWQQSHERFRQEFRRMSELSLTRVARFEDLRSDYDKIWNELQEAQGPVPRALPSPSGERVHAGEF